MEYQVVRSIIDNVDTIPETLPTEATRRIMRVVSLYYDGVCGYLEACGSIADTLAEHGII